MCLRVSFFFFFLNNPPPPKFSPFPHPAPLPFSATPKIKTHMPLPPAPRRDKVTQTRWGLADFRHRFGREPEGMWLPETAADDESLEVLAEAGVKFTILAPHQAWRIRRIGGDGWEEVHDRVDPSRPYPRL